MASLENYLDEQLSRGRAYFYRDEALAMLGMTPSAFTAAAGRLVKKQRLACPRRGFYLILRPEDRVPGAPDPARWIGPLMKHLDLDYRVSLLRAAAFHGASHQAAMVIQVIVPRQIRSIEIGRHRLQFVYQDKNSFSVTNKPVWLSQMKTEAGYAKIAGVELTLLDCARYFHKSAGIDGVAQIARDIGARAKPRSLAQAAVAYENSAVRRLGYLLEVVGHERQSAALEPFARKAKSLKPLNPSIKSLPRQYSDQGKRDMKWMLLINQPVEVDF